MASVVFFLPTLLYFSLATSRWEYGVFACWVVLCLGATSLGADTRKPSIHPIWSGWAELHLEQTSASTTRRGSTAAGLLYCRADSRFAPSQWETALLCNDVSHWLGASLESALYCIDKLSHLIYCIMHALIHIEIRMIWFTISADKRWSLIPLLLRSMTSWKGFRKDDHALL